MDTDLGTSGLSNIAYGRSDAGHFLPEFLDSGFMTIDYIFTLANYREAASDPIYGELMWRSLRISGFVTVITVVLAFPVAYYVSFRVAP